MIFETNTFECVRIKIEVEDEKNGLDMLLPLRSTLVPPGFRRLQLIFCVARTRGYTGASGGR